MGWNCGGQDESRCQGTIFKAETKIDVDDFLKSGILV